MDLSLPIVSWSDGIIVASVPNGASTGQLQVTRGNGKSSITGVTVTVGGYGPTASNVIRVVAPGTKIQAAIDAANRGDMIMVPPGRYDELVIMNKMVRLQGWGAPSTHINAAKVPAEKLTAWRSKISQLLATGGFDLLPGQNHTFNAANNELGLFNTEEGPGIMVVAKGQRNAGLHQCSQRAHRRLHHQRFGQCRRHLRQRLRQLPGDQQQQADEQLRQLWRRHPARPSEPDQPERVSRQ